MSAQEHNLEQEPPYEPGWVVTKDEAKGYDQVSGEITLEKMIVDELRIHPPTTIGDLVTLDLPEGNSQSAEVVDIKPSEKGPGFGKITLKILD